MDWSRKWLAGFDAGEAQLVSFDWSNITGGVDVKMDGHTFLNKSNLLRCWDCLFILN